MKKIISLILVISMLFGMLPIVNAETGSITLTASSQNVNVGDTVDITLKASDVIQSADFNLNYPKDILELQGSSISTDYYSVKDTHIQICYASNAGTDTFTFTFNVIKEGEATISTKIEKLNIDTTTEFQHDGDKTLKITATEKPTEIEVNSVTLNKNSLNLEVGETETLTATVEPEEATDKTVIWSSDNAEVASVQNGKITAIKEGTAQITATAGTKSATCTVTVTSKVTPPPTDPDDDKKEDENGIIWTDFSKASTQFIDINNSHKEINVKINNVDIIDNHTYYMAFADEKYDSLPSNYLDYVLNAVIIDGKDGFSENGYKIPNKVYETNTNLYIYILDTANDKNGQLKYKINTITVDKSEKKLFDLGSRFNFNFDKEKTTLICNECISNEGRKANIKIGNITDVNILKSIKNKENDALSKLLNYAKNDKGVLSTSFEYNNSDEEYSSIYSLYNNWTNNGYYYVYMQVDDENGKYMPIEDINLVQCKNTLSSWNLVDSNSKDFIWNINDDGKTPTAPDKDDSTAKKPIPQTGETMIVVISIIGVLTIAIISIIKYRRYRDI